MKAGVPLLHDYLEASAARLPGKVALVCRERRATYAELDGAANALAHELVRRGVLPGDRVLVFADNGPEAVVAFWAALKANAVVSPVNPLTKEAKLDYLLNDCRAKALVTNAHLAPAFAGPAARSPHLKVVVCAGDAAKLPPLEGLVPFDSALATGPRDAPPPRRRIDVDLAALLYTSGSTGEPKGVMLTHRNMLAASASIAAYLENVEDDVFLGALPLAFDYGLYQLVLAFMVGARLVLERSFAYPAEIMQAVVAEGVTAFPGVPTIFSLLEGLKAGAHDLSRVRYVTNTAAALHPRHVDAIQRLFPNAKLFSMYGLTECKRCTYLPPADLRRKPGSVGVAIPNTELWLVDEHDRRVGPGVVGQLVIRGATVMQGYWEKPEATAERLRPGPVPGEQVLYTGDLCRLDDDGYLYFVGRMDDIIKSRGEKVAPKEVEQALLDVPGVVECAVIGVPDDVLGQAVKAFVVLAPGSTLTARELQRECHKRLEPFLVPKVVELVLDLPRTATGKIKKTDLS